ncbi:MAG: lytic transglycosylase domain-containing protein, partial [Bdellovibrionales bacterium]|nr:lytic transglycosylase domain-containing protein [Bdellovibrionales bacterium]
LKHMEEIFRERNMPAELTRLPFVESSFNWKAHSKAGARGIWQFMRGTGRKFMRVNRYYDERMSPLKSTHAAAKLLKQNHKILKGHWPLALTAYNHGPSGVRKASEKTGTTDMGVIADNYKSKRFSFASANFYSSFLAALYVEKYKDTVFSDLTYRRAPNIIVKRTKKRIRAKALLRKTGLSRQQFLNWNPDLTTALKRNYRVPKNYTYYISKPRRLAYRDSIAE